MNIFRLFIRQTKPFLLLAEAGTVQASGAHYRVIFA